MDRLTPPLPHGVPFEWPDDPVDKFSHPYIKQTAVQALSAYIAGLVNKPDKVALLTSSVEVVHRMVQSELRFCYIFFLKSAARVDPTDTVMVRIASEPPQPGRMVNDVVPMQDAELFVWTGQQWHNAFTFKHRASRFEDDPIIDPPAIPTFPLPDPLSDI